MYVDSHVSNEINVKYHSLTPQLNDILDFLHGACVYSRTALGSGYHWIHMNPGYNGKVLNILPKKRIQVKNRRLLFKTTDD